jgi:O-antigen ligase
MVLLNSLDVIRLSWLGDKRPFGFAGIMFVDFSALGICLTVSFVLFSQGLKRIFFLILSFIIAIALILTQTRNTCFSAIITLGILIGYLIVHPDFVRLSRKRLFALATVGLLMMIGTVILALMFNPKIENRATELTEKSKYEINEQGYTQSSIITRLFIWDTALNAFRAHPIIGIGVYAFRFSSNKYYKFSKILYTRYVAKLTPHQTHLAVLAETGLIGFIGFLIFIVAALKHAFQAIKLPKEEQGKRYALIAAISVVYCTVSMVFTDAWLWGQCIVLLGLVLGSMLAIRKINSSTKITSSYRFQ